MEFGSAAFGRPFLRLNDIPTFAPPFQLPGSYLLLRHPSRRFSHRPEGYGNDSQTPEPDRTFPPLEPQPAHA
ncbi:protein of unknown function [Magnetospirillum gryphiswaldense MSR-1 v2]|uniref:Uncharacterized protein n=1 Tax=Magnetospirillum gryphiswaldense (strain DSM 6361 / JCM 21280 / NBRC 15271 / MSR-1) TaxID=431944 RepID=V6F3S2_MAGGM|nr:protein of unknown function [Magnetospirillum gryphiswaldense MSR-1 v2]